MFLLFCITTNFVLSQCVSEDDYWNILDDADLGINLDSAPDNLLACYQYFLTKQDTAFALYSLNYALFFNLKIDNVQGTADYIDEFEFQITNSSFKSDHILTTDLCYLQAILNFKLGNTDLYNYYCREYLKKYQAKGKGSFNHESIYEFLGFAEFTIGDYNKSIQFFKQALSIAGDGSHDFYTRNLAQISEAYLKLDDINEAENYLKLSQIRFNKINDVDKNSFYYRCLISYYMKLGEFALANKYIQQAQKLNAAKQGKINLLLLKGQLELATSDPQMNETFQKAYQFSKDSLEFNKYKTADVLLKIGRSYFDQKDYKQSIYFLNLCIETVWDNQETNNNLHSILNPRIAIEALTLKSNILSITKDYKESMQASQQSIKVLNHLFKHKINSLQSSTAFISKIRNQYAKIIDNFAHSDFNSYSFTVAQQTKAILLSLKLNESNANKQFNVDQKDLSQINQLRSTLSSLNSRLANPGMIDKVDSLELKVINNTNTLDSLMRQIEIKHPSLHKLKYADAPSRDIKDIQSDLTDNNSALIEYFLGEDKLYTFLITKAGFEVMTTDVDSTFFNHIFNLNAHIRSINSEVSFDSFVQSSEYLYDKLIAKVEEKLSEEIDQLYIIPDGEINYIPFSVLFEKGSDVSEGRYEHLPYIVKHYAISYHYSSALLDHERTTLNTNLSSFAPSFTSEYSSSEMLEQLLHNQEEVLLINDIADGQVHIDSSANLPNLRKSFNDFRITHLATHASCNDTLPFESKIHMEDGPLHAYEIYNLPNQLDLAVLSACQTGDGVLKKGEGLMSLARAFISSGCKSVITSLWSVNDKNTSTLMSSFYKYLWKGEKVSTSLGLAKRDFLNNVNSSLQAHPYNWASFIMIGNADLAIYRIPWAELGLLLFLVIVTSAIFFRLFS